MSKKRKGPQEQKSRKINWKRAFREGVWREGTFIRKRDLDPRGRGGFTQNARGRFSTVREALELQNRWGKAFLRIKNFPSKGTLSGEKIKESV